MASRRVLLLVGPCRVDGGDGASTGDLGSLGDVDKARQTRRTSIVFYARKRAPPTRSDPPHPSPHPIQPQATLHEEYTSKRLVEALDRAREACVSSGSDAGWGDVGLGAPPAKFACCSWWPDVGAIEDPDGTRSDQRWIEGTRIGDAIETMATKASKCTRDTDDDDDELTATTHAEASSRALKLIKEEPSGYTDVVWITAGVRSDTGITGSQRSAGGGENVGEWPGEAVAAWGVLRSARAAGAKCSVVALAPKRTSTKIPSMISAVAARAGLEASLFRGGSTASASMLGIDPGLRWRGSLLVPSAAGGRRDATALPGVSLSARGSGAPSTSQPSTSRRVEGDMLLLEVVRLEVIPPTHLSSRPALRFTAEDGAGAADEEGRRAAAARDGVLRAWTSVVESVPPARAPAFIVRISLGKSAAAGKAPASPLAPAAPHANGPVLMLYADGSGGFLATALASFQTLLGRALVQASACSVDFSKFESADATNTSVEVSEMTTTSNGSGGRKRARAAKGGKGAKKKGGSRLDDENDSAATRADLGEEALKAVAMMDVNMSLPTALMAGAAGATDDETTTKGRSRRRSVRLSQDTSPAPTPSSKSARRSGGDVAKGYGADGGMQPPPIHQMLDVLMQRHEADNTADDEYPFLTGVLLRTVADVAAGNDILPWALRTASNLASTEGGEDGKGDADGEGREVALADSGGERPSKSGTSSHQHIDFAVAADDTDLLEKMRQKDRRERTKMALAPKKGTFAMTGKRGAAILAAAGGRGGRDQTAQRRRDQPNLPEREPSESAAGANNRVAAGTAAAAVAKTCPTCNIELAPIPGMKHCYGCGGPL